MVEIMGKNIFGRPVKSEVIDDGQVTGVFRRLWDCGCEWVRYGKHGLPTTMPCENHYKEFKYHIYRGK